MSRAVVVWYRAAVIGAYQRGYNEFEGVTEGSVDQFKESSDYVNNVAPELRRKAGYEDGTDAGTYTTERTVAMVSNRHQKVSARENPKTATLASSEVVYQRLVDAFDSGARAALNDEPIDPPAHLLE